MNANPLAFHESLPGGGRHAFREKLRTCIQLHLLQHNIPEATKFQTFAPTYEFTPVPRRAQAAVRTISVSPDRNMLSVLARARSRLIFLRFRLAFGRFDCILGQGDELLGFFLHLADEFLDFVAEAVEVELETAGRRFSD